MNSSNKAICNNNYWANSSSALWLGWIYTSFGVFLCASFLTNFSNRSLHSRTSEIDIRPHRVYEISETRGNKSESLPYPWLNVYWTFFKLWYHCTKMHPTTLMYLSPLSGYHLATLQHVFRSSGYPLVPNPILESHASQSSYLLPTIPILALECLLQLQTALNPSLLQ